MPSRQEPTSLGEGHLRRLVEYLPVAAAFVEDSRVWFNKPALDLLGYPADELATLDACFDVLFPEHSDQVRKIYESDRQGGFASPTVLPVLRKDGQQRNVEFTAKTGNLGEIWLLRDVTDEHRLSRLREQAQSQAGMGAWELDCATGSVYWSPEVYRLFDVDPREFRPQAKSCFTFLNPVSRELLKEALQKATEQGTPFDLELDAVSALSRPRTFRCSCQVETDPRGKPKRLVGWCQDITARKEDERTRQRLDAQLRQAQKLESLSVLAGGVAHDFNNLLTSILGYTSLARMELPPESPLQEYLREVEMASRRAAELTQQMLAYSGKGRFILTPVKLDRLVRDMLPLLQAAVGKRASLELDLGDLPVLEGDLQQLRQVILSLVYNAAEAIDRPGGCIFLRAGKKFLEEPNRYSTFPTADPAPAWFVFLQVQDNGSGMSREVLARVFDPFFSTKFTGRGLGMAAVLGIVKGHRGLIRVDSESNRGTTVEVLFPIRPDQQKPGGEA